MNQEFLKNEDRKLLEVQNQDLFSNLVYSKQIKKQMEEICHLSQPGINFLIINLND